MQGYLLKIGSYDCSSMVKSMKIGYETIVDENAGRNAAGTMVFDIIAEKRKLYITIASSSESEMSNFLSACNSYVNTINYYDPETKTGGSMTTYHSTIEPDIMWANAKGIRYKDLEINFIEM